MMETWQTCDGNRMETWCNVMVTWRRHDEEMTEVWPRPRPRHSSVTWWRYGGDRTGDMTLAWWRPVGNTPLVWWRHGGDLKATCQWHDREMAAEWWRYDGGMMGYDGGVMDIWRWNDVNTKEAWCAVSLRHKFYSNCFSTQLTGILLITVTPRADHTSCTRVVGYSTYQQTTEYCECTVIQPTGYSLPVL
jgi:hypothetical protein